MVNFPTETHPPIDVPPASESVVGQKSIFTLCSHGERRQKALAPNIQSVLNTSGSILSVFEMPGGWSGIVNSIHKSSTPETPSHLFFSQMSSGGHVITASHDAYGHLRDLLKARSMSNTLANLTYLDAYSSEEEIKIALQATGIL